ncbi:MAG: CRISPR-associated protein Cas4 [archaeon]
MGNEKNPEFRQLNNARDISDYLYCARKVYLRKILHMREKPNERTIAGVIRHDILDELNKAEAGIVTGIKRAMNLTELGDLYKNHLLDITAWIFRKHENSAISFSINPENFWNEFWNNLQDEIQLRIKSISKLIKKNIFGQELWEKLEPKYLTEFKIISDKLHLVGRIDRIVIENDKGRKVYIPYEVKNASVEKPYESDMLQLACYALLLEDNFQTEVNRGIIQYKNKRVDVDIGQEKKQKVLEIMESINNFSEENIPHILENFNKCRHCGLHDECFGLQK